MHCSSDELQTYFDPLLLPRCFPVAYPYGVGGWAVWKSPQNKSTTSGPDSADEPASCSFQTTHSSNSYRRGFLQRCRRHAQDPVWLAMVSDISRRMDANTNTSFRVKLPVHKRVVNTIAHFTPEVVKEYTAWLKAGNKGRPPKAIQALVDSGSFLTRSIIGSDSSRLASRPELFSTWLAFGMFSFSFIVKPSCSSSVTIDATLQDIRSNQMAHLLSVRKSNETTSFDLLNFAKTVNRLLAAEPDLDQIMRYPVLTILRDIRAFEKGPMIQVTSTQQQHSHLACGRRRQGGVGKACPILGLGILEQKWTTLWMNGLEESSGSPHEVHRPLWVKNDTTGNWDRVGRGFSEAVFLPGGSCNLVLSDLHALWGDFKILRM